MSEFKDKLEALHHEHQVGLNNHNETLVKLIGLLIEEAGADEPGQVVEPEPEATPARKPGRPKKSETKAKK